MVICMYFLNGNCRFGSRCNNEHIDIGSIVKNEVDVTLKGNQWPLSCFGPFKERNCIPNFIDDQSFEEIRMMYLEAKMQNNIPAHQMQLAQMINDAKGKLQCLTTNNRDVLSSLVELYNQQESSSKPANTSLNPFASMGTGNNNPAPTSIFGSANSGPAFGSGFGSTATSTTGNIFGVGAMGGQTAQTTGNIFGTPSPAAGNIFAKPAQQPSAGNIFGMGQSSQPPNNVFGGPSVMGGGLFGSVQQTAQNTTSMFGAVAPSANPSVGGNIFGTAAQTPNAFSQQTGSAPPFGGGSMFGGNISSGAPAAGGFGGVVAPPAQTTGLFNSVSYGANQPSAPFGQFGSSMHASPAPSNASSQNLFLPTPAAGPFGAPMGTNAFGGPVQTTAMAQNVMQSATMYSKMENLNAEHVAAFNLDQFLLGRIPTVPPPKEMC